MSVGQTVVNDGLRVRAKKPQWDNSKKIIVDMNSVESLKKKNKMSMNRSQSD